MPILWQPSIITFVYRFVKCFENFSTIFCPDSRIASDSVRERILPRLHSDFNPSSRKILQKNFSEEKQRAHSAPQFAGFLNTQALTMCASLFQKIELRWNNSPRLRRNANHRVPSSGHSARHSFLWKDDDQKQSRRTGELRRMGRHLFGGADPSTIEQKSFLVSDLRCAGMSPDSISPSSLIAFDSAILR